MKIFLSKYKYLIFISIVILIITGCATYYTQTIDFQKYITSGNFQQADNWLEKNKKEATGKNQLLYYLNRGYVSWILQNYNESNFYFTKAEHIIEDYIKNYYLEAITLLSNPNVKPYRPEDFETIMLNYFMALNYLKLEKYDDALVECRRINIKLQQLNDKYKDHKNRYQRDAFAHTLMGIIYENDHDYNNAFIAYRNALNVYETDYNEYFNIPVPQQLKKDLLRTAYLTGFYDEVEFYEKKFSMNYHHKSIENGELIFFWLNGFGPYKTENSINFVKIPNQKKGYITLVNEEYDLSFPIYIGDKSSNEKKAFEELRFFRVAFPKYVERPPVYKNAAIFHQNNIYQLQRLQDINEIAFKTLKDRMVREMANAIMRLATKKALELLADEQDESLGTIINIVNTITEKADTRNWQTLPYSISYCRVPLNKGENKLMLKTNSPRAVSKTQTFYFKGEKDKIYFHAYHTTASYNPHH